MTWSGPPKCGISVERFSKSLQPARELAWWQQPTPILHEGQHQCEEQKREDCTEYCDDPLLRCFQQLLNAGDASDERHVFSINFLLPVGKYLSPAGG